MRGIGPAIIVLVVGAMQISEAHPVHAQGPADSTRSISEALPSGVPLLNVMKMFGNHEGFLQGFYGMFKPLYLEPAIAPRYREVAYLRASQLNSCHY